MKRYLLPESGNFYKANLHMHTSVSDGVGTPEEVKKAYLEKGYSIIAYSDHEVLVPHNDLSDEHFLAITSFEKTINKPCPQKGMPAVTAHMNFFAKDRNNTACSLLNPATVWGNAKAYITDEMRQFSYQAEYSAKGLNEIIRKANEEGFLVTLNHPVWSLQNYEDYKDLKGLWGIEVYNTASDVEGYPDTVQPFEDLLRKGEHLFPVATDDAHKPCDRFGGYIMIKADRLEYSAILQAMENGDFYASTGPEIRELYVENNCLHVTCSDAVSITLATESRYNQQKNAENGNLITEAEFDLAKFRKGEAFPGAPAPYFRVTVKDTHGKEAFSRAYFLDELN